MSLAKSHSNAKKKDRKALPNRKGDVNIDAYDRTERVIDSIYVDITNGISRSDCIQKVMEGMYDNKPLSKRQATFYYDAAIERFTVDTDIEHEKLKNVFYTRYESLLADAIESGDRNGARAILDSMAKLFLDSEKKNTNIQINSNDKIEISFGFPSDSE